MLLNFLKSHCINKCFVSIILMSICFTLNVYSDEINTLKEYNIQAIHKDKDFNTWTNLDITYIDNIKDNINKQTIEQLKKRDY